MRLNKLLAAASVAVAITSPAWAGDIRPVVNVSTTQANDLRGVAFGPGGKIYVSGHSGAAEAQFQTVVGRFNADGTPDASFGSGGFAKVDLAPGRGEQSLSLAVLANGDVVTAVNATDADGGISVYLLRFDSAGVRKTAPAWGDAEGKVEVVFGWANAENALFPGTTRPADQSWDVKVDISSGAERLVVAGFGPAVKGSGRTDNDRYVVRLNAANGAVDPSFNGGKAFAYHSVGVVGDNARRVLVEADGSILAAGYSPIDELGAYIILTRLTPAGVLDANFGGFNYPPDVGASVGLTPKPGVAVLNPMKVDKGNAEAYGVAKLADGSYVTTGYGQTTATNGPSTLGFKSSVGPDMISTHVMGKSADANWGKNGAQSAQSEGMGKPTNEDRGRGVVGLKDDRTVHVGRYGGVAAAFVLTKTGAFDTAVNGNGIIELPHASIDVQLFGVALSPDGKRIATTTSAHANGARLVVLEVLD